MAENSAIEWTDHTFNPWEGCQKVGPGCDHCYAETRNARYNGTAINWGPGAPRRRTTAANWRKPLKWTREAAAFFALHGRRQRVFCSSLADVFDNAVDPQWRADLAALIVATPELEWLLLTKRIGNALHMLIEMFPDGVPANVRIGATLVNQDEAARDLFKIAQMFVACQLKPFLSIEPLLGPMDLAVVNLRWGNFIGWVIVGGESGPGARPMQQEWAQSIVDQCRAAGVAAFVKQLSSGGPKAIKDIDQFPEGLRVRGFPA
jgi:protein gp37